MTSNSRAILASYRQRASHLAHTRSRHRAPYNRRGGAAPLASAVGKRTNSGRLDLSALCQKRRKYAYDSSLSWVRRRRLSAATVHTFCKPRLGSDNETAFRASPGVRFGIHKSYPFTDIDRPRKRWRVSLSAPSISRRRPDGFGEGCKMTERRNANARTLRRCVSSRPWPWPRSKAKHRVATPSAD